MGLMERCGAKMSTQDREEFGSLGNDLEAWWNGEVGMNGPTMIAMAMMVGVPARVVLEALRPMVAGIDIEIPGVKELMGLTAECTRDRIVEEGLRFAVKTVDVRTYGSRLNAELMVRIKCGAVQTWLFAFALERCDCGEPQVHFGDIFSNCRSAAEHVQAAHALEQISKAGIDMIAAPEPERERLAAEHRAAASRSVLSSLRDVLSYDLVFRELNWTTGASA